MAAPRERFEPLGRHQVEQRGGGDKAARGQIHACDVSQVALLAVHLADEIRCTNRERRALLLNVRPARFGPNARRGERRVEQRAIVVDEPPALFATE